jgi:hypothetical protein
MTWVAVRLQRTEGLITAFILLLIAALLIPTGIEMANAFHRDGLSACVGVNNSNSCANSVASFLLRYGSLGDLVTWLTLVPGIFGVLLAAPFVLELENGTYRLAWTQSITRRRWLAGKLGVAVASALTAALVLTLLMTWWRTPFVKLDGRLENASYDFEGIVVFGYVLFALGLAVAVGAIWRKAVPALIVAYGGYFAARIFVDTFLRKHLVTPLSVTWPASKPGPDLSEALVISAGPSNKAGHYLGGFGPGPALHVAKGTSEQCIVKLGPNAATGPCPHARGYMHAVYQPASHFWALQGVETAIFGGIGVLLILLAAWWTHERTA